MDLTLDRQSSVPVFQQIVVALQYRIATGKIEPGEVLPSLREAAAAWEVNYHTVRRAYDRLSELELVRPRRGVGTVVAESPGDAGSPGAGGRLAAFLHRVVAEARDDFGIGPHELAAVLRNPAGSESPEGAAVTVVECNAHQCSDLAGQIRRRYAVEVRERLLGQDGEPPDGPLVGTYFHLAEMHRTWPGRRDRMFFPTLVPDPSLRVRLLGALDPRAGGPVPLCERDVALARAMADDVSQMMKDLDVLPTVDQSPAELRATTGAEAILVAPRLWDGLPDALRADPRLIEARYVFREYDLETLASALGWERRERGRWREEPEEELVRA